MAINIKLTAHNLDWIAVWSLDRRSWGDLGGGDKYKFQKVFLTSRYNITAQLHYPLPQNTSARNKKVSTLHHMTIIHQKTFARYMPTTLAQLKRNKLSLFAKLSSL